MHQMIVFYEGEGRLLLISPSYIIPSSVPECPLDLGVSISGSAVGYTGRLKGSGCQPSSSYNELMTTGDKTGQDKPAL